MLTELHVHPHGAPHGACACRGKAPSAPDLGPVAGIVRRIGRRREHVIPILQALQAHYRFLPPAALERVCELTEIRPAEITGVATFYKQFRHRPTGRHLVRVCVGTACYAQNAEALREAFHKELHLAPGQDTDAKGEFTIEPVACLGCCTLAPVVQAGDATYGNLTLERVPAVLRDILDRERESGAALDGLEPGPATSGAEIRISLDACCLARGADRVYAALRRAVADSQAGVRIKSVGCIGLSCRAPLVEVLEPGRPAVLYAEVQPEDAAALVRRHFRPRGLVPFLRATTHRALETLYTNEAREPVERRALHARDPHRTTFLGLQQRIATEHCGALDPLDLDEYRSHEGFQALERALRERRPEEVIAEVQASGLRGRGGAGYPTGLKWEKVRQAPGALKYAICNGDEGDPGAFMDRMVLESYPFRVIEGLALAAWAVGAHEGIFYVRAEYPLAVRRIEAALRCCEAAGLLGENILGSGYALRMRLVQGAGAFVCGEETALIASVEGRRGMPHPRPPFPASEGLWGAPTLINNVETLAMVPWILRHGAPAFAALGTARSKGTKVFGLAGKVRRGGLVEVPMGVTLREIVEVIGGGMLPGRTFKAVQIGGPSGGCVPARLADTPVDYEALQSAGAIMGSGGLVVLDDTDCMVDIARYFLSFAQDECCGRCSFGRLGTRRMLDLMEGLCAGRGKPADLVELEHLGNTLRIASLCGLGKTAPNPVLSTLRHFPEEYQAHLEGRCPAGKCKKLIRYEINAECTGCTRCAQHCPSGSIQANPYRLHIVDPLTCTRCDACRQVCPVNAVEVR